MARAVGGALIIAVVCGLAYLASGYERLLLFALLAVGLMIPLGSFLRPPREQQQLYLKLATGGIAVFGVAGILLLNSTLLVVAGVGLLGYQFLLNALIVRDAGRTFGD